MTNEMDNFELSVDDIVGMVQEEIERQNNLAALDLSTNTTQGLTANTLQFPVPSVDNIIAPNFLVYVNSLITLAETKSHVRREWPKPLDRFPFNLEINKWFQKVVLKFLAVLFRDQRTINLLLVQTLRESLNLNQRLADHIVDLQSQINGIYQSLHGIGDHVNTMAPRLDGVVHQTHLQEERLNALTQLSEALSQQMQHQRESLLEPIQSLTRHSVATDEHLRVLARHSEATDQSLQVLTRHSETTDQSLQALTRHAEATDQHIQTFAHHAETTGEHLRSLTTQVDSVHGELQAVSEQGVAKAQKIDSLTSEMKMMGDRLQSLSDQHERNDSYLKSDLAQQKRLITLFLEQAQQQFPDLTQPRSDSVFKPENYHTLDAFYIALEDEFRGRREEIKDRLRVYLPYLDSAALNIRDSLVLDLGCGRGEWLDLLRESGYTARGIDLNQIALEQCRAKNLDVLEADALTHLRSLPTASVAAVTAFHLVEHLPFEVLVDLLDEIVRVLQPQGLIIFETPNPENTSVGSCTFYLDPTHQRPLPSLMMEFLTKNRGFTKVKLLKLNPAAPLYRVPDDSELANRFNEYFYGPMDYAVIGVKP